MKKKIFYLIALIFSISVFSSAKKLKGNCGNEIGCDLMKSKATNETELSFPSLGLFLFNN
jgi:hypothetical protein